MVNVSVVNEWRIANLKRLQDAGLPADGVAKLYSTEFTDGDPEVASWAAFERAVMPLGFEPLYLAEGRFFTRYGGIQCRCFLEHQQDCREYTIVARALTQGNNIEVAVFKVAADKPKPKSKAKSKAPAQAQAQADEQYHVSQVSYDIAALVLPPKA